MFLASFHYNGHGRVGARLDDAHLIDFNETAKLIGANTLPTTMRALIGAGPPALARAEKLLALAKSDPAHAKPIPIADVRWHPPVRRPGKICCVALNNSASDDRKISSPDHPLFFMKPSSCLIGHGEPIVARPHYAGFHPEPELGVIVGTRAKDLDPKRAMDHVFGYTIFNDITGADMRAQDRVHYWALYPKPDDPDQVERREQHLSYTARYKGSDTFGPAGPFLATKEEIPDPHNLDIVCSVGGDVIAEDSTAFYTFRVEEVLAFISRHLTLEPGDIVSMGTAFRPSKGAKRSLHSGNLARLDGPVDVTITGLGTLSNPVVREPADPGPWRLPR